MLQKLKQKGAWALLVIKPRKAAFEGKHATPTPQPTTLRLLSDRPWTFFVMVHLAWWFSIQHLPDKVQMMKGGPGKERSVSEEVEHYSIE